MARAVALPVVRAAHLLVHAEVLIEVVEHRQRLEAVAEGAEVGGGHGDGGEVGRVRVEGEGGVRGAQPGQGSIVRNQKSEKAEKGNKCDFS